MRAAMNRKAATTGGFTTSLMIHGGLLLLFMILMRAGPEGIEEAMDELTEIAYIEARYGEDVAKKVRMKTKPIVEETAPVEQKVEEPEPVETKEPEAPTPQPTLQSKPMLQSRTMPKLDTRSVLKPKTLTEIEAPTLSAEQQRQFVDVTARRLDSKKFAEAAVPDLDTSNLRNAARLSDIDAPNLQSRDKPAASFQSDNMALVGKKSSLDLSEVDFEVGAGSGSSGGRMALQIATGGSEDGHAGLVGGNLQEGQVAYQGSVGDLVQSAKANARRKAVEIDTPTLADTGNKSGRRTLLDYGSGGLSSTSSLSGRQPALAEAPSADEIVEQTQPAAEEPVEIAEVASNAAAGSGVSMTVSGQIVGRKIVRSSPPQFSAEARRKGWEGVVAVHFTVMPDGRVKDNMYFEQTSAHRDLNRAAMAAIKQFQFEPLASNNRIEQWGVITIVFRLS